MSDLIDRQAAINAIENTECELSSEEWDEITDAIMSVPSAQPEIVRCKDCKHRDHETNFCHGRGWPMSLVPDDDYCSYAERRSDETN